MDDINVTNEVKENAAEQSAEVSPKRKTKTSSSVKNRYNSKMYDRVSVMLPKELVRAYREKCAAEGISLTKVVKEAIEAFVADEPKE